jgi:hypothetical protein
MESEPEREIEKQLKAYAKKRRQDAGAPLELHPVTRRMLQEEVAALRPANSAEGPKKTWMSFWPRLAMAGFLFTILGIGAWAMLMNRPPAKTSFDLAQNRPSLQEDKLARSKVSADSPRSLNGAAPISPAPAVTTEANATLEKKAEREFAPSTKQDVSTDGLVAGRDREQLADTSGATSPVLAFATKPAAPAEADAAKSPQPSAEKVFKSYGLAPAASAPAPAAEPALSGQTASLPSLAAAPPPAAPAAGLGFDASRNFARRYGLPPVTNAAGEASQASAAPSKDAYYFTSPQISSTQKFLLATADSSSSLAKSPQNAGVLKAFVVEQSGETMRVVDGDGSTYLGYVNQPAMSWSASLPDGKNSLTELESLKEEPAKRKLGLVAADELAVSTQSNFFRVAGTNLSLHQPVVFTGSFVTTTNFVAQMRSRGFAPKTETPVGQAGGVTSNAPPVTELHLLGHAVIGLTNQVDINAVPAKP